MATIRMTAQSAALLWCIIFTSVLLALVAHDWYLDHRIESQYNESIYPSDAQRGDSRGASRTAAENPDLPEIRAPLRGAVSLPGVSVERKKV